MRTEMDKFDNDFITLFLMRSDGYILFELFKKMDIKTLISLA